MKIVQVSKADSFGGGASKVAVEIQELLDKRGVECKHLASWSGGGYSDACLPLYGKHETLVRNMHDVAKRLSLPEYIPFELPILKRFINENKIDIVHFHDISSAISPLTLSSLSKTTKVVWTLHDCSPFTGGCLYPMGCEKFKKGCGDCPQAGVWPIDSRYDTTRLGARIKKYVHSHPDLNLVAPSNWMADMAVSSGMVNKRPSVIPNGVDIDTYHPKKKTLLDNKEISTYKGVKIVLSAGDLLDHRKGVLHSIEALETIKDLDPLIILIGNSNPAIDETLREFHRVYTGYISEPERLATFLASADIFLFSSLADNMPLAILESLSCGTPLIGYATGGIPDMIDNDVNGYVVTPEDRAALGRVLRGTVENKSYLSWGEKARDIIERKFSHEVFIGNYMSYYQSLLD